MTLLRLLIVPGVEDGVAVEPDLQDAVQFTPVFRVKLTVLAIVFLPFLGLYDGASEDDQVPIQERVLTSRLRNKEANRVPPARDVSLEPLTESRMNVVWLFRQNEDWYAVVPLIRMFGGVEI